MVNWFCVTSNNHPVTRTTIPIQWQKLFQAPEPKLSSQKTTTTLPPPHLFPLLLLWSFLLPLFTTAVTAKCKSLPKNSLLFGNAFLPGSAAVPLTPDSLVPFNLLRQANLSLEDSTPDSCTYSSLHSTRRLCQRPSHPPAGYQGQNAAQSNPLHT